MTKKPLTIFDKPAPTTESILHSWSDISAEEIADLKIQAARGLGHAKLSDDAPDELANAVGEFGSATNPIGCDSVASCLAYIKRLRTREGRRIQVIRKGCSVNKAVSRYPVDEYILLSTDGKPLKTIFMSGYQRCDSTIAPEGFTLAR